MQLNRLAKSIPFELLTTMNCIRNSNAPRLSSLIPNYKWIRNGIVLHSMCYCCIAIDK